MHPTRLYAPHPVLRALTCPTLRYSTPLPYSQPSHPYSTLHVMPWHAMPYPLYPSLPYSTLSILLHHTLQYHTIPSLLYAR